MNKKIVVIHQPDFIPYLGFFQRLLTCDVFVILDHIQFSKSGWVHRDKIKTSNGVQWITIPIKNKGNSTQAINDLLISDDQNWRKDHLNKIRAEYRKAGFFEEIFPQLQQKYLYPSNKLVDFNIHLLDWLLSCLDISIYRLLSSTLSPIGKSNAMNIDIIKKVAGTDYISGIGARAYHNQAMFDEAAINVVWQEFMHPVYSQLHGEFVPNLSVLDILFNCGIEKTKALLRGCSC